jgi:biopolymer transport protein ExbB
MKLSSMKTLVRASRALTLAMILGLGMCLAATLSPLFAQTNTDVEDAADATLDSEYSEIESVEVDWWEQIISGGMTMVALGVASIAGIAFTFERALTIREKYICPRKLANAAIELADKKDLEGLHKLAAANPSTLGRIILFITEHEENEYEKLSAMAENIGAREMIDQEERTFPLAVIAAIAPLLGLLGTMIGMIEAFQMVAVYGDEGGASMLAGSIAKALITTAFGLILAIPAIGAFHFFKHKLHKIGVRLEKDLEAIITKLFFVKSAWADETDVAPEHKTEEL